MGNKQYRITKIERNYYFLNFDHKKRHILKGVNFHKFSDNLPMVGDFVKVDKTKEIIVDVLSRENELTRPKVANVKQILILMAINKEAFNRFLLNKMIFQFEAQGFAPILVFTKTDLLPHHPEADLFEKDGYKVIKISNITHENIEQLRVVLENNLSVLVGNSGAGKSTTLNCLFDLHIRTQKVSKIHSGKHTTRTVEIFKRGNIEIIDTPGFSQFDVSIDPSIIGRGFIQFDNLANQCQFRDCIHLHERRCAVKKGVAKGKISKNRYDDYLKIMEQIKNG